MKRVLKIFGLLFLMCLFLTGCGNNYLLEDVPVEIKGYNKDAYVVEGSEKTMDVNISGDQSVIDEVKKSKNNKVVLDLKDDDIPEKGKYFKYTFETDVKDKFDYEIFPEGVTVKLEEKVSDSVVVEPKVINLDKLDKKLGIKSIKLNKSEVIIRGSQDAVDKVDIVEAEIDISELYLNDTGTFNYYDAVIKYYDKDYNMVENIEVVTQKTDAQIVIHEGENLYDVTSTKTVPVNINLVGYMDTGTAVSSVTIDGVAYDSYMLEIEGKGIDEVNAVDLSIDVTNFNFHNGNKVVNVTLSAPSGVRKIKRNGKYVTSVKIQLNLGEAKQKLLTDVPIKIINVPEGKVVKFDNPSDSKTDVYVVGTEANLANITANDIEVFVDAYQYDHAGVYYSAVIKVRSNNIKLRLWSTDTNVTVKTFNK